MTLQTPVDLQVGKKVLISALSVLSIFTLDNQIMLPSTTIAYIGDMAALTQMHMYLLTRIGDFTCIYLFGLSAT